MRIRVAALIGLLTLVLATSASADDKFHGYQVVRVLLNQQEVVSDVPAVNFFGRSMLPVRAIADLAGLTVDSWDPATNTVSLSKGPGTLAEVQGEAVAMVNGKPITRLDLYNRLVRDNGAKATDQLITEMLVDQAAVKAGVIVSAGDIDAEVDRVRDRVGGEEALQKALAQNNITMERFRQDEAFQIKIIKLMTPGIRVDDTKLMQFYKANQASFDKRQVHARHILVKTQAEAAAIKAQLDAGADFAALAREKSIEPAARTSGGDLGFFGLGTMVQEFQDVVFNLKAGETSDPFQTQFGWHVAQVLEVKGTAPDFESVKADVTQAYIETQAKQQYSAWLAGLKSSAEITNLVK